MEVFSNGLSRSVNYLSTMGISDFLDIIIVAYLIYKAIGFVRRTNSNNLAKGLVVFLLALWGSDIFSLTMINFLLRKTAELGLDRPAHPVPAGTEKAARAHGQRLCLRAQLQRHGHGLCNIADSPGLLRHVGLQDRRAHHL